MSLVDAAHGALEALTQNNNRTTTNVKFMFCHMAITVNCNEILSGEGQVLFFSFYGKKNLTFYKEQQGEKMYELNLLQFLHLFFQM